MTKASYLIVVAGLLCCTILVFSFLPSLHSLRGDPHPHALSSPTYKSYIVFLRPPPEADIMDHDARLRWYQSFLPSSLTNSGEPRIIHTYKTLFTGFAAWLTEAELNVMSKKPGCSWWLPDRTFELPYVW